MLKDWISGSIDSEVSKSFNCNEVAVRICKFEKMFTIIVRFTF